VGDERVSRWADAFTALSRGADTVDTVRHSSVPPSTLSHCVHSVTGSKRAEGAGETPAARGFDHNLGDSAPAWSEAEEERAAIIEHDGGVSRAWAEGFARLHPDRPPGDVPLRRWRRFVDDVGLFLDKWARYAAALGWGPYDLFGCDRDRPFARIDQAGLLWLLNGDKLIALSENTATIETRTGARQTYRRKPSGEHRVLAWELAS
jgi:hypothetical protein